MEKLTRLPEDILDAVSSNSSAHQKQSKSERKSSKPAALDTDNGEAKLSDNESELKFSLITSSQINLQRQCRYYC